MSLADIQAAMQQVQAVLAQLQSMGASSASGTDATDSAARFADALDGATGSTPTASAQTVAATDPAADASGAAGVTGDDVVQDAKRYLGVPYVYGGESTSGMDCSGLVQKVFSDLGVTVGRQVHNQQTEGSPVASLRDAKPGDLIVLDGGNHIAIYAGDDKVIHAPYAGRTVSLQKIWFTDKDITTIRRIVPATADSTTSTGAAATAATAARQAQAAAVASLLGGDSDDPSSTLSALLGGASDGSGDSAYASLLGSLGSTGSSNTTSAQLLAARAALLAGSAA